MMEKRLKTTSYLRWEEKFVAAGDGVKRNESRFYLVGREGGSDLAVVGREKRSGKVSYRTTSFCDDERKKFRSKRDVVDFLNSFVSGWCLPPLPPPVGRSQRTRQLGPFRNTIQLNKVGNSTTEFFWEGSARMCRKNRRHYESFNRNGVRISANGFVFVLADGNKRLVAYLDDMYEDSRGNKMALVRWFHKVDEVGIASPDSHNDKEIFFSLCLQDLSIESIDGLATVLSPQHYKKFQKDAASRTKLVPFVCHRLFDNDEVKPFDVSRLKGYWEQEIFSHMSISAELVDRIEAPSQKSNGAISYGGYEDDRSASRPWKRLRRSKDNGKCATSANDRDVNNKYPKVLVPCKVPGLEGIDAMPREDARNNDMSLQNKAHYLAIGSRIEVLSQDSGLRGCWFKATIIEKHNDKIKVRYEDLKDAIDESVQLEEWVLSSRVAMVDQLGIRLCGRTTVRPAPLPGKAAGVPITVGSIVDAWWHDGWWEGIVVQIEKQSEDRIHVYFPGEKRKAVFGSVDLRHSEEWLVSVWKPLKGRPELLSSIFPEQRISPVISASCDVKAYNVAIRDDNERDVPHKDSLPDRNLLITSNLYDRDLHDVSREELLTRLKWNWSTKKRVNRKNHFLKPCSNYTVDERNVVLKPRNRKRYFAPSSLKVDQEKCSFVKDTSLFGSSVASLTGLVMSQ